MTDVPLGSVAADPAIPIPLGAAEVLDTAEQASTLRIALLSDAIPGRNGVGTYYDDLVGNLSEHVAAIELFAPPSEADAGYRGLQLRMPGDPTQQLYLPSPAHLNDRLRAFRPDVVVAATPWLYGVLSIFMARRLGAAVCIGYHTQIDRLLELYWARFGMGGMAQRLVSMWDRLLFRFGDVVLVHNERLISAARAGGARSVSLVGTPVPRTFLETPLADPPTSVENVVFVGRLAPEKEVGQIVAAAERYPGVNFVLVGDGPLRSEVDEAAARLSNLDAVGWVDRDEVRARIDAADVLVLPSRYETFGSAAFEAMIRGRPAIVSPHCGIARWPVLAPGLVVMADGESLSDTLARVRSRTPAEITDLSARAREASRVLSRRTVEHWLAVLTRTARARATDGPR